VNGVKKGKTSITEHTLFEPEDILTTKLTLFTVESKV